MRARDKSGSRQFSPFFDMQADFRGWNDTFYALLSAPGMHFGARTTDTDFRLLTVHLVHGTFITDAVWVIRGLSKWRYAIVSSASKIGFDVLDANQPTTTVVAQRKGVWQTWKEDGILAFYKHQTFFVRANGWEAHVTPAPSMALPHTPLLPAPAPEHTRLLTRSLGALVASPRLAIAAFCASALSRTTAAHIFVQLLVCTLSDPTPCHALTHTGKRAPRADLQRGARRVVVAL